MFDQATERPTKKRPGSSWIMQADPNVKEVGSSRRQESLRVLAVLPNRSHREITVVETHQLAKEFLDFVSMPEVNCNFLASCDRNSGNAGTEAGVHRIFEIQETNPRRCALTSAAAVWLWFLCRRMNASLEVDGNQSGKDRGRKGHDVFGTEPKVQNLKFTFASTFVAWAKDSQLPSRMSLLNEGLDIVVLPDLDAFAKIDPLLPGDSTYADHVFQYCCYDLCHFQVKVFPPHSTLGFLLQRGDVRDKFMEDLRIPQVRNITLRDNWNSTMMTVLDKFRTNHPQWDNSSLAQDGRYVVKHRFGSQPKRIAFLNQIDRDGNRKWVASKPDGTELLVDDLVTAWAPHCFADGVSFEPYVASCRNQEVRVFTSIRAKWDSAVDLYAVISKLNDDGQHEITQRNLPVEICFGPQALYHQFVAKRACFLRMLAQMAFHPLVGHVFRFDCFVFENDVFINDVHVMGVADTFCDDPVGLDAVNMMAVAEATHRFVVHALEHGWPV